MSIKLSGISGQLHPIGAFTKIETSFQCNEEEKEGLVMLKVGIKYDALMENGATVHFEGPFKLYMSNEGYGRGIFILFVGL